MTDAHTTTSGVASPANSLAAVAALGSLLWVVGEFAIRRGLTPPIGDGVGSPGSGFLATLALTGAVLGPAVAVLGTRVGISPRDWDLSLTRGGVLAVVGVVVAYYAVIAVASFVYVSVLGGDLSGAGLAGAFDGVQSWVLVGFVLANGVLAPVAEEVAWRGVVQTALVDAYGATVGIAVAAAVFAAKHVVVDLGAGPMRATTLIFLALAFGVLRHRYGTSSSIVAHVLANSSASVLFVLA